MLAEERKNKIIDLVNKKKIIKVADLSAALHITEATIRRDLDELEKRKKLQRIHGGAISLNYTSKSFSTDELSARCIHEKKIIAQKAYEFISENDALLLDSSTTVLELSRLILEGNKKRISIVTNSFTIVNMFEGKQDIRIIHTGGQVNYTMKYSIGTLTEATLRNLRVDKCFLGTNGIDEEFGYSVPTFEDAAVKMSMLKSSKQKFILADHSKFGDTFMGKFAPFCGEIDYLITDTMPEHINIDSYHAAVCFIVASKSQDNAFSTGCEE